VIEVRPTPARLRGRYPSEEGHPAQLGLNAAFESATTARCEREKPGLLDRDDDPTYEKVTWMPVPAPTEIWSLVFGVRRRMATEVSEGTPVTTTVLTAPVEELVSLPPPGGGVTPEMKKSNCVGEAKCGSEIRLARSEK
jgi:hypothetical protein